MPTPFYENGGGAQPREGLSGGATLIRRVLASIGRGVARKIRWTIDRLQKHWFSMAGGWLYVARTRRRGGSATQNGRLFVDVSVICHDDAATGIQRVVRSVALLLADIGKQHMARPVFVHVHRNRHYIVRFAAGRYELTNQRIYYAAGDTFIGLDYALDTVWRMRAELARMRHRGVRFWYVVHDLLPLTRPDWFSFPTVLRFRVWLAVIAGTADGFFCVSSPVERELRLVLGTRFGLRNRYRTVVIPMGWDVVAGRSPGELPEGFPAILARLQAAPAVLMVGTIEPRKGHADVLMAMELLWSRGTAATLVLVGGSGWKTAELQARLAEHDEAGRRLLVLGKVSDAALERLYECCTGVIVASFAEGFGLPVIEAIGRGKRVLARNLEVFAQHAGKGVTYFPIDANHDQLAHALAQWLFDLERLPTPSLGVSPTWSDTAETIRRIALERCG